MDEIQLKWLNESYKETFGKEPKHFVCPILMKDEDVELCDGHVLNAAIKSASRLKVTQRKDVDNYLGSAIEPDLITFLNISKMEFKELIKLKKGRLTIKLPDETESEIFFAGPAAGARFQRIALTSPNDGEMVAAPYLKKGMIDGPATNMELSYEFLFHDNSLIGGMLKSAYLALFRHFGYRWMKDPGAERIRVALRACHLAGAEKKDPNAKKTPFFKNFAGCVKVLLEHPFTKDTLTGNAFLTHAIPYRKKEILFGMSCLFLINGAMFVVTIPACFDGGNIGRSYSYYCNYLKNPSMIHVCRQMEFRGDAFFANETPFPLSYKAQ